MATGDIRMSVTVRIEQLMTELAEARATLRALEELEHPDIIDIHGRVWTWKSGDIYTHDSMAWPESFVRKMNVSLPSDAAIGNPNYTWCDVCRAGR